MYRILNAVKATEFVFAFPSMSLAVLRMLAVGASICFFAAFAKSVFNHVECLSCVAKDLWLLFIGMLLFAVIVEKSPSGSNLC
eukprot:5748851-Amphidinium_carterae.1